MKHALRRTPITLGLPLPGLAAAAYVWLLLDVILAIPTWVAFIAAGGVLVAYAAAATIALGSDRATTPAADPRRGDIVVDDEAIRLNPLVNVRALRLRFAGAVTLMLFSAWLLIETLAFHLTTQRTLSFASAIAITALALLSYAGYRRRSRDEKQSVVMPGLRFVPAEATSLLVVALGAWQIVATRIFSAGHVRWLSFENGCVMLALGLTMLIVHEFSSERIVHVLEVAGWDRRAHREHEAVGA